MKTYLFITAILLLAGCRVDRVDISELNPHDQALFELAAIREGVEVTLNGQPWDWVAKYNLTMTARGKAIRGRVIYSDLDACRIDFNPLVIAPCTVGGIDQRFKTTARHELRHCQGLGHSNNPENLMYAPSPCWPVD